MVRPGRLCAVLAVLTLSAVTVATAPTLGSAASLLSHLSIGTHPTGSLYATYGAGIAEVLSAHTAMDVRAVPTNGPVAWMPLLARREIDLGVLNAFDAQMAYLGQEEFAELSGGRGFPVRLVAVGAPNINGILVAADSGIRSGRDLRGRRYVTTFTGSRGITLGALGYLANFGLTTGDVVPVAVPSITAGLQVLMEGRVDATYISVDVPAIRELDARRGALFLPADPSAEAVAAFQRVFPAAYAVMVQPEEGLPGIRQPTPLIAYDTYLVARADLPDDAVYEIVRALWEHISDAYPVHPRFREWRPAAFVSERPLIPYHPGAVRFYQERGAWSSKAEAAQQELLRPR